MIILAVGDSYMAARYFREAFRGLEPDHEVKYFDVDLNRPFDPSSTSDSKLGEYQGSPSELAEHMAGWLSDTTRANLVAPQGDALQGALHLARSMALTLRVGETAA